MANININWGGVTVILSEADTKTLENSEDLVSAVGGMLGLGTVGVIVVAPFLAPVAGIVARVSLVVAAYLQLNKAIVENVDQGYGVSLTLPWAAIWLDHYWLIIPTSNPPTGDGSINRGTITVRRSTGHDFGPSSAANEDWTHGPCYGSRGTFFADVDGDGKAECILVNDNTITVRRSTGHDFGPSSAANEDWSHGPCYGNLGTFFADVDGDRKADCVIVNGAGVPSIPILTIGTITVRRSTGHDFGPSSSANEDWTHGPYFGNKGTFFVDVTGDGKADAIVVNGIGT
jgi:hypothetical protein